MNVTASLSVVIPSYCRADLLSVCLESIKKFTLPTTQIIVVDDGSPDSIISKTANQLGTNIIRFEQRSGFCAAANAGIAAARGEVVQLLNDDAELASPVDEALANFVD